MTITFEQIGQGWKPYSEITKEPLVGLFQDGYLSPVNGFISEGALNKNPKPLESLVYDLGWTPIFRRLIPLTPDTIVLSREDAKYIYDLIYQNDLDLTDGEKATIEQLNANSKMLREVLRQSVNS